jgi:hypothetical protein
MSEGIAYTTVNSVTDADGKGVDITSYEREKIEKEATTELEKALRSVD